jgi:hypothetical protein
MFSLLKLVFIHDFYTSTRRLYFVLVGRHRTVLAYGNSVSVSGVAKYQAAMVWIKYS